MGAGGPDDNKAQGGFYVPEIVAQALSCKWSKGTSGPAGDEHHNLVATALRAEGFDASQDGTGRQKRREYHACSQKTHAGALLRILRQEVGEEAFAKWGLGILGSLLPQEVLQQGMHDSILRPATFSKCWLVYCALSREKGNPGWLVQSLREAECERCASQGWQPSEQLSGELGAYLSELSQPGAQAEKYMQDLWQASEGLGILREALSEIQKIWRSPSHKSQSAHICSAVRRLTPTECEFLMGFPRNYTAIPFRGHPAADGPRYKALGNSMAVPVMHWIGQRIEHQSRPAKE